MNDAPLTSVTVSRMRPLLFCGLILQLSVPAVAQDVDGLLRSTRHVRALSEEELVALVPEQSGLLYVGCPHCTGGRQERQLEWSIERPNEVQCTYCQHIYPSDDYPMTAAVEVRNPRGEPARFEYWADEGGYRYFFKARRDDEVRIYLARQTQNLAALYAAGGDRSAGRRAALLLDRFAQVFPGWCYHYDYPFQQKEIYDGPVPPERFRRGYRTARWTWWAYNDIPDDLVDAWRVLRGSDVIADLSRERGVNVAARIERDLLRNAAAQVLANQDDFTNKSPGMWQSLVRLGRLIEEPQYIHEVVRRLRRLIELKFFYDGFWHEGAPSYGLQTLNSLDGLLDSLQGYSDPPGYVDPIDGTRFDNLSLTAEFPVLHQARATLRKMVFPDGRMIPVHDTWATAERRQTPGDGRPYLIPALGHACLAGGAGSGRGEWHLTWSGGYGHQHADMLGILLFTGGREAFSDLGYTHTAWRSWTLATAAHNTVVIDGLSQHSGSLASPSDGGLRFIDLQNDRVQVVSADGERAYPGLATTYRRTLVMVNSGRQQPYTVDVFDVAGGNTHDYFLHGDADGPSRASSPLTMSSLPTLLPEGMAWTPTTNEGQAGRYQKPHYAYGFLRSLRTATLDSDAPVDVDFQQLGPAGEPAAGVRVTMLPEEGSQLILGENPSIRQANEDDSRLELFHRPFLTWRQPSAGRRTRFVTIMQPFQTVPLPSTVTRLPATGDALILQIDHADRTDVIVLGAETEQAFSVTVDGHSVTAECRGQAGVLTLRGGAVEHAYSLGDGGWQVAGAELTTSVSQVAPLADVDEQTLLVSAAAGAVLPRQGDVVRLLCDDGWVYPYHVVSASRDSASPRIRIQVAEGPAFDFDQGQGQLRFRSFPQREHQGPVQVAWQVPSTWSPASRTPNGG